MDNQPCPQEFTNQLLAAGLLIGCGVPGVFAKGRGFEEVLEALDRLISVTTMTDGAEFMRFPPIINRRSFERSEFLNSLPHLAGSVFSFSGTEEQHRELVRRLQAGEDWSALQSVTDVVLTPAACYPLYPLCAGTLPEGGRLVDLASWCFRHEPSPDPARMQMFRMREHVRLGDPGGVQTWRDTWLQRGLELLRSLQLPVCDALANDPFFGRGGRLMAASQRELQLKFELLVPIASAQPTAVMSFNYHQDHFGDLFGIRTADGAVAHTACLGFGMERIVLALLKTHGLDHASWPAAVRQRLWP
ncbi:MAG TPA: amino acid--[acyl-carrier-protein] ligase [Pseudomonadota bacterium]|nr:amino acid--[acyl-carrier-protein] ligase [Pseudomonadota bacterium]